MIASRSNKGRSVMTINLDQARHLEDRELDLVAGGFMDAKDAKNAALVFGSGLAFPYVGAAAGVAQVYFWLKS